MVIIVATVYNEIGNIRAWYESIKGQGKIFVVDGGSTDGTCEFLGECDMIVVQPKPRVNIKNYSSPVAVGRNMAIRSLPDNSIVVVTDAGCTYSPDFVRRITAPFETGLVDVVGGRTAMRSSGWMSPILPLLIQQREATSVLTASSRAIAFKKSVWEMVGGYPEVALTAEDTAFNVRLRDAHIRYAYAGEALCVWDAPETTTGLLRQCYRYGKGDAICNTHTSMYAHKLLKYLV